MTLGQLIAQFRRDTDDTKLPYLWPDPSVVNWLNEAEQEACRRSQLLIDSATGALTPLTTTANVAFVSYDTRIIRILRARPRGHLPVPIVTAQEMDDRPNWEDETGTDLKALITDMATDQLRTYPVLTAAFTIDLTVQRLPLTDMSNLEQHSPEIKSVYHIKLIEWAKWRAYSIDDVDANDPQKAAKALATFEHEFGKTNANVETWFRLHGGRDLVTGSFA